MEHRHTETLLPKGTVWFEHIEHVQSYGFIVFNNRKMIEPYISF